MASIYIWSLFALSLVIGLLIPLTACSEQGSQGVPGMDMSVGGLVATRLSLPPPEAAFGGPGRSINGRIRDLDSAVSWCMSREEMAVVEQADTPLDASAAAPGDRIYRMVTMQDRTVWLKVQWAGVQAPNETVARRSDQQLTIWARAGEFGDASAETRLVNRVSERLSTLRKQLR